MKGVLAGLVLWLMASSAAMALEETKAFGRFGTVHLYAPSNPPRQVVLFASGDGGWNLGVVAMARELAGLDALVVGIDVTYFLKQLAVDPSRCSYPAADFEALSHFIQKQYDLPRYIRPVLVGYSSGATLVYAVLAQAPANTFRGAVSMGFCPDLPLAKPLCAGSGLQSEAMPRGKGYRFLPTSGLPDPWIAFQGEIDQVCDPGAVRAFVAHTGNARLVSLPKVGHGFSVPRNWLPQFRAAFGELAAVGDAAQPAMAEDVQGLPLVEVPATAATGDILAVMVSGDGGWAGLDKDLAASLARRGVPVVGLDSLQYFWSPKTPDELGRDLQRILAHYLEAWGKSRALLVGYSLGAEALPFMVSRLPLELVARVPLVALLGPGSNLELEIHVSDWLGGGEHGGLPVLPEVRKLDRTRILCIYGEEEAATLCRSLEPAQRLGLAGGHHFGGDYQRLASAILDALGVRP